MPPAKSSGVSVFGARLLDLPRDRLGEPARRQLVGVLHDRHDEPLMREVDGDAEIDVRRKRQPVALQPRIDAREIGDRDAHGARDERADR